MPSTHIDHVIRRLEYVIQWSKKITVELVILQLYMSE